MAVVDVGGIAYFHRPSGTAGNSRIQTTGCAPLHPWQHAHAPDGAINSWTSLPRQVLISISQTTFAGTEFPELVQ